MQATNRLIEEEGVDARRAESIAIGQ
jgi:hypothetical protein